MWERSLAPSSSCLNPTLCRADSGGAFCGLSLCLHSCLCSCPRCTALPCILTVWALSLAACLSTAGLVLWGTLWLRSLLVWRWASGASYGRHVTVVQRTDGGPCPSRRSLLDGRPVGMPIVHPGSTGWGAGAGITCPAQPVSVPCSRFPLDRRKSHTWRARLVVLASRVKLLPGDALSGLEQACLFSAVLQSWHAHNNGGQETRAGSMWYLVSVIFCNTYVLPVEMAEVSVFVSHLIHLASPRCLCLSGSRWSFVFWDPLSLRPYLCLTGQGIYNLLPLLCKSYFPPGSQRAAPTAPVINQLLLKPRTWMLHNTDLFHFWKYRIQPPPPFYPLLKVVKSSALLSIQQQLFVEVEEVIHNKTEDCAIHCTLDFKIYPVYNFKCENGIPWKHRDRLHLRSLPAFL